MRLLEVEEGRRPAARTAPSVQPDPSRAPGRLRCTAPHPSASLPASSSRTTDGFWISRCSFGQLLVAKVASWDWWALSPLGSPGSGSTRLGPRSRVPRHLPLGRRGQLPVVSSQSQHRKARSSGLPRSGAGQGFGQEDGRHLQEWARGKLAANLYTVPLP